MQESGTSVLSRVHQQLQSVPYGSPCFAWLSRITKENVRPGNHPYQAFRADDLRTRMQGFAVRVSVHTHSTHPRKPTRGRVLSTRQVGARGHSVEDERLRHRGSWLPSLLLVLFPSMNGLTYQHVWTVKWNQTETMGNDNPKRRNDPITKGTGDKHDKLPPGSKPDIFDHHIRLQMFL